MVRDASGTVRPLAVKILRPRIEKRFRMDLESYDFAARMIERLHAPSRRLRPCAVVDTLAKRLQTQEALTEQIVATIEQGLAPRGVAILVEAEHQCMSLRGIRQCGVDAITHRFTGLFETDEALLERYMKLATA